MTERLVRTFPVSMKPSSEGTDIIIDVGGGIKLKATSAERLEPNGEATLYIPYRRSENESGKA